MKPLLLWAFVLLVVIDLLARFDAPAAPLPVVQAGWQRPSANPDLLFVPCPLDRRNLPPFRSERKA